MGFFDGLFSGGFGSGAEISSLFGGQPKDPRDSWGKRSDGSRKDYGFFGPLQRPDGGISTEISVGVNMDGKDVEIPSLVPTLNKEEVNYLLQNRLDGNLFKTQVGQQIMQKAVEHARLRMQHGLSPFADEEDYKMFQSGRKQ